MAAVREKLWQCQRWKAGLPSKKAAGRHSPAGIGRKPCYGPAMQLRPLITLALLPITALTAACAKDQEGRYPSLAIRDVERIEGSAQVVTPAPAAPVPDAPSPDLLIRLDQLTTQAGQAHNEFLARTPTTERNVRAAAGSAIASDRWVSAQIALAELERSRSQLTIALAELDALRVAAELDGAGIAEIGATWKNVDEMAQAENAIISRLISQLPG